MAKKTIYALSSAHGKSAIAVYRISGPNALGAIIELSGAKKLIPRILHRATLIHPTTQEEIDDVMFVYFNAPNSFTGEDVVEIYTHGSIAVQKLLFAALASIEDLRYAEAGEFSKRALFNGKIDLTRIEGMMDLINAETHLQHKQALSQMQGALFNVTSQWRVEIIQLMSLVEAYIDFPEEEIPDSVISDSEIMCKNIIASINHYLSDRRKGERLRNGIKLAIYGKPNVGKSSLVNYLTQRDISIVSTIPGTTRDIIESHIDIGGYPIILLDTAGIRDSDDEIEQEGIKRAKAAIESADINIFIQSIEEIESHHYHDKNTINVINKIDLKHNLQKKCTALNSTTHQNYIEISLKNNTGLEELINTIIAKASDLAGNNSGLITKERHRVCMINAVASLQKVNLRQDLVLAAEDLRIAAQELSYLIGKIDVEDLLDQIFLNFCIGK